MEGKAMTITELTIEAQRRGCRSSDSPRVVAHAIRNGLPYIGGISRLRREVVAGLAAFPCRHDRPQDNIVRQIEESVLPRRIAQ